MSTLYLLNYNNYCNRIWKSTTLASYKSAALHTEKVVNFNENDGCTTTQVVNIANSVNPDYVVVTEGEGASEAIASRWFIIERTRERLGQYTLQLRRDAYADYKQKIRDATIFCEKGYVADTDPLIFNSEGNTYNQIKTSEVLLKDATNCAWIVGYCDYKLFEGVTHHSININASTPAWSESFSSKAAVLSAYPDSGFTASSHKGSTSDTSFIIGYGLHPSIGSGNYKLRMSASTTYTEPTSTTYGMNCLDPVAFRNYASEYVTSDAQLSTLIALDKHIDDTNYRKLQSADQKIIRVETNTPGVYEYYKLNLRTNTTSTTETIDNVGFPMCYGFVSDFLDECYNRGLVTQQSFGKQSAKVWYYTLNYTAVWEDITETLTADIQDTIPRCETAPYYMFVMPYYSCQFDDGTIKTASGAYTMPFVQSLIATVGTHVLDVQLLPYFPDQYLINAGVVLLDEVDTKTITWLKDGNDNKVSFIYWGAPQTFKVNILQSIAALPSKKVDNETRFCRITAPNYSASFDFSIAKNNGVSYFHASCTYRPYQPHIQITPEWSGVYGQYYADGRGLICGGDYSVDIVNDAWTEYQINNKNYQLMFDRQIQTMDLQHDVQRMNEKFQVGANILSTAANGAMAGAAGGLPGMIAGGLAGGVLSAIGGGIDIRNNQRLRADQRSAAFDMFNYNLGNIQARPTTITKMSALVGNNKIWPFYEIYSATSREVAVLNLQLQYSGMTVGAIGTVKQYLGSGTTFIRGRIIRITGLENDAEMSQFIADELARGVYIT